MPGTIRGSSRSPLGAMAMPPRCLSTVSAMACRGRLPYRKPPARPYPTRWLRPVTCRPDRAWQRSIGVRWSGIPAPANRPRTARASGPGGASRQGSVVSPQLGAGWGHGGRLPGLVVAAPTRPRVDGFGGRLRVGHVGGRAHHAAGYSPAGGRTGGDRNLLVAAGSAGMDVLGWILLASAVAFATKLVGYLLPHRLLAAPWHQQASTAMTIGLLAALVATNAVASGQRLVLDSQVLSLVAAALALRLRAPYPAGGQHRSPRCRVGTPGRIALTQPGVEPPARRAWRPTRRTKSNTPVPLGIRYPPPRPVVRPASTL